MTRNSSLLPPSIRRLLRGGALAYLERREERRPEPPRVIWILAHMRSGSTLLMHLLSSHPQILGAGERNATYSSTADLRRLAVDAAYTHRQFLRRYDYVVDQINHDRFLAAEELLDHPQVLRIFLVREPLATLASMIEVLGRHYGMEPQQAVDSYLERLPTLERYARRATDKSRSLFVTYGELVDKPGDVLACLTFFLGLRTPLEASYRLFSFTGKRGDPSDRITAGRILGNRPQRRPDLPAIVLERVTEAHSRCTGALAEHCRTVAD